MYGESDDDAAILRARYGVWPPAYLRRLAGAEVPPHMAALVARAELARLWEPAPVRAECERWPWPWWQREAHDAPVPARRDAPASAALAAWWAAMGTQPRRVVQPTAPSGKLDDFWAKLKADAKK